MCFLHQSISILIQQMPPGKLKGTTWQSLHFHTKFASPRLPGIPCCSCLSQYSTYNGYFNHACFYAHAKEGTYKSCKTDIIRMRLSTRSTLYLEGVVIGDFFCVLGTEVIDSGTVSFLILLFSLLLLLLLFGVDWMGWMIRTLMHVEIWGPCEGKKKNKKRTHPDSSADSTRDSIL